MSDFVFKHRTLFILPNFTFKGRSVGIELFPDGRIEGNFNKLTSKDRCELIR